jgi:hypothetical protein
VTTVDTDRSHDIAAGTAVGVAGVAAATVVEPKGDMVEEQQRSVRCRA